MRYRYAITTLLVIGVLFIAAAAVQAQQPAYPPGELLVQFKPQARSASLSRSESTWGVRAARSLNQGRIQQMILPPDLSVEAALAIFQKDPDVDFAEPNYFLSPQNLPDDPLLEEQWGLYNIGQTVNGYVGKEGCDIDAQRAWEVPPGSPTVVAVVDTGCNHQHPDLAANIWTNDAEIAGNGIDDDHNGYIDDLHGWDFSDHDNNPQDASGHGTHVAGIIAAQSNNGMGVAGVARQAKIMPLRFMNAFDLGTVSDAILAIEYAVAQGVHIINCSWGSAGYSASLYNVMASSDALFVCAAGNNGTDNDSSGFYPASYGLGNVISVAATDQMDALAWFSNYGAQRVHVAAPGIRIYSLGYSRQTLWSDDFSDNRMDDWTTGGDPNTWTIRSIPLSSGANVLAVGPDAEYPNNADTWAMPPVLDLSQAAGCQLTFQIIGALDANRDYLYVEVSEDLSTWSNRPVKVGASTKNSGLTGSLPYWTTAVVDLGPFDGAPALYLRFRFVSNADTTASGYYIDNITVSATSAEQAYQFMSGTSMAAGFVSGAAALLLSQNSTLTPAIIKQMLIDSVDKIDSLKESTLSGGRINVYSALMLLNDPSYTPTPRTEVTSTGSSEHTGGGGGCFIGQLR